MGSMDYIYYPIYFLHRLRVLTFNKSLGYDLLTATKLAVEFRSSRSKGTTAMCRQVYGFFYVYSIMVGVLGSLMACRLLCPVFEPDTSATSWFEASGGSFLKLQQRTLSCHHNNLQ